MDFLSLGGQWLLDGIFRGQLATRGSWDGRYVWPRLARLAAKGGVQVTPALLESVLGDDGRQLGADGGWAPHAWTPGETSLLVTPMGDARREATDLDSLRTVSAADVVLELPDGRVLLHFEDAWAAHQAEEAVPQLGFDAVRWEGDNGPCREPVRLPTWSRHLSVGLAAAGEGETPSGLLCRFLLTPFPAPSLRGLLTSLQVGAAMVVGSSDGAVEVKGASLADVFGTVSNLSAILLRTLPLELPLERVGQVIGVKGQTIAKLREDSGAQHLLAHTDLLAGSDRAFLMVVAPPQSQAQVVLAQVQASVRKLLDRSGAVQPDGAALARKVHLMVEGARTEHSARQEAVLQEIVEVAPDIGAEDSGAADEASLERLAAGDEEALSALRRAGGATPILAGKLQEALSHSRVFEAAVAAPLDALSDGVGDEARRAAAIVERECRRLSGGLPMYAHRDRVVEMARNSNVLILKAETGSGKSTQVS